MSPIVIVSTVIVLIISAGFLGLALLVRAWEGAGEMISPPHRAPTTNPKSLHLPFEPVSFKAEDGLTCRGWFFPAGRSSSKDAPQTDEGTSKDTIVLSHGYAGDCSPDLSYVPMFHKAGYNVLLFDYRGHGTSDGNHTSLVYYERRDLLAALQFLRARGIERVGLLGFSMGGAVVLATAPQSDMVVGVISDCTFGELKSIVSNEAKGRGVPPAFAGIAGWLVEFLAGIRVRANLFSADPIHWVGKIAPRPVLIMHGAADESIPVSEAHRLFEAAGEPKELWIVPKARHRAIEDVAAKEYHRRVLAFFDKAFGHVAAETPTPRELTPQ